MVLPLLAVGEALKVMQGVPQPVKDNNLFDFVYQPLKGKKPDPHYPSGVRVCIPAWLILFCMLVGIPIGVLILASIPAVRHTPGFSSVFQTLRI